jgi:transposase
MFLKRQRKQVNGQCYEYWTLCESVRTDKGPRQRIVARLGKLTGEDPHDEAGWEDLQALLEGRPVEKQPCLGQASSGRKEAAPEAWEAANIRGLRVERSREFGRCYLGLALWHRLGLSKVLGELIQPGDEEVPWPIVASILTVARFCAQPSELGIAQHWYQRTALEDLTGVPWDKVNDDRLYRGLDMLGKHKDRLCTHLMERYRDWFGVNFEFLLYDVTSTFFEGQALGNELAARGYSRDKRSDCKQVCIGLVCTPEGLPLAYEVFAGNRTDVTTVQEVVTRMEDKYGQPNRVWVMDRGMVSEGNIEFLRERGARYLVGTPKSELRHFEAALLDKEGWSQVQPDVEARLVDHPDGEGGEQFVLCRSAARAQKERAMLERQRQKLMEELGKVAARLRRKPVSQPEKIDAVMTRVGRWLGRYAAAARQVEVSVKRDEAGRAVDLNIKVREERDQWSELVHGAYLLRTNCTERDPAQLWKWYVQLTQAEAAFRTAKSDLGLRPVYHQLACRVEAHILVCFLALAMWRTLEQWMGGKGLGTSARQLVEEVGTIQSMDVVVPVRRGEERIEMRVRTVARPAPRVAELLQHLGLRLPVRNRVIAGSEGLD